MAVEPGSSIVFVSSNLAQVGMPGTVAYSATKGAVEAMARALAVELAPDIRVNTVAPGIVRTPMTWRLEDPAAALGAQVRQRGAHEPDRAEDVRRQVKKHRELRRKRTQTRRAVARMRGRTA